MPLLLGCGAGPGRAAPEPVRCGERNEDSSVTRREGRVRGGCGAGRRTRAVPRTLAAGEGGARPSLCFQLSSQKTALVRKRPLLLSPARKLGGPCRLEKPFRRKKEKKFVVPPGRPGEFL